MKVEAGLPVASHLNKTVEMSVSLTVIVDAPLTVKLSIVGGTEK